MDFMKPIPKGFPEDVIWLHSCEQRSFFTEAWHDTFMICRACPPNLYKVQEIQNHSLCLRRVASPVIIFLATVRVLEIIMQVALKILWTDREKWYIFISWKYLNMVVLKFNLFNIANTSILSYLKCVEF